ncbi:carboxylic acid reductase [Rhodococcus sp. NBC_00294]|uniref:carboxylic acid reductase n=1 Tax=Rhodococcus sp. NBC_00294 TaxID=2976004 RepID=UPI002E2DB0DB|nr:carboxylic acid reductase [Rhodococcus sp. NBC_00294]
MTSTITSRDTRTDAVAARAAHLFDTDAEVRAAAADPAVSAQVADLTPDLHAMVEVVMDRYADRPALGRRAYDVEPADDGRRVRRLQQRMDTITYGSLWSDALDLATALGDVATPDTFVATLGFAGADYVVAELATVRIGAVAVPLQSGAAPGRLADIAAEVEPVALVVDNEQLSTATAVAAECPSIRRIVVLDHDDRVNDDEDRLAEARRSAPGTVLAIETLREAIARGRTLPRLAGPEAVDPDRIATLIYTSGSTGTPKGAIHTQRIVSRLWSKSHWYDQSAESDEAGRPGAITLDYLPMSHLAGRAVVFTTLAAGGIVYFASSSDLSTLLDDYALARPTVAMLVPRVCDLLRQTALGRIETRAHRTGESADAVRAEVLEDMRSTTLGGRILSAVVGTAPTSPEVIDFVSELLDTTVQNNYGSTEAGMVLFDGVVQRPPVLEYRLDDVPELGYAVTDRPYPRGELLLKTDSLVPGYYKRPDVTAEMFSADGFYRTGDVVAETEPDHLVYVDRRKNVLKLAQGEFVALSRLESIYASADAVDQIHLHGSGERSYLLAVVVPADGADTATVLDSLQALAREEQLESYEVPRDIVLAAEPFTQENGLLSGANKQLRPALTARYGEALEDRYREIDEGQTAKMSELRRRGADAPVLETVGEAAAALLGCAGTEVSPDAHFTDLGGDSLSALTFATLLQDIFEVDVPVTVVIAPSSDLAAIATHIERRRGDADATGAATFASVHGAHATQARADQLTLSAVLGDEFLSSAADVGPVHTDTRTVLLTGANGYLGRFLCLEWLERQAAVGGTVVCLVRGRTAADARARLDTAFDTGDPALWSRWTTLADTALEVVVGDVGEANLGVSDEEYASLAERVDRIVHPAALVNHALPYEQLFGPNVIGTAEIARLALTHHLKPVTYLSTVAVAAGVEAFSEDGDIREISPVRALDESYANGYGTSKWAGEVVLRNASDAFGLPVTVFRSDMILAHPRWTGQLNVPDIFTRTVLSLIATGIAPETFYRQDTGAPVDDAGRPRAHYDGLPADFTAAAITELGGSATSGHRTFDVLNPHDDGISLDTVVDWIIQSGRTIRRIADYDTWFAEFSDALESLPSAQRSASVLPLRHAYARPDLPTAGSPLPAEVFRAAVRDTSTPGSALADIDDIPHLSRDLVAKYVRDLEALGLIPTV